MKDQLRLFLWSKDSLDEWMTLIESMKLKRKLRGCLLEGINQEATSSNQNGIYENAALPSVRDGLTSSQNTHNNKDHQLIRKSVEGEATKPSMMPPSKESYNGFVAGPAAPPVKYLNQGSVERESPNGNQRRPNNLLGNNIAPHDEVGTQGLETGPTRPLAEMINGDDAPAKDEPSGGDTENLSSGDLVISDRSGARKNLRGQSANLSESSSVQCKKLDQEEPQNCEPDGANRTICRDSNDNLVLPGGAKSELEHSELSKRQASIGERKASDECQMGPESNERFQSKQSPALRKLDDAASERSRPQRREDRASSKRIEGGPPVKQERPVSNLIRRDDSWHSSLSLNQVGNNHMQAAKRSLYAQSATSNGEAGQPQSSIVSGHFMQRPNISSIDATATPLRGRAPFRQQSMQPDSQRRLPTIRQQQQANSFDVGEIPNSSSQLYNSHLRHHPPTSYHKKLLQLQLLHNSNNIDYVRNNVELNGGYQASNVDQIYGPGSIATTNHYGYYSMRSNLKSAASEFSFIRPNSSDFHPSGPMQFQPSSEALQSERVHDRNQYNNQASQALANNQFMNYGHNNGAGSSSRNQYLVQNAVEHVTGSQGLDVVGALSAPDRDLPLKPNKKRQQLTGAEVQSHRGPPTTFGSSIVHFFRRAFSKRSKRRPKLAESCSSSLGGALDDKFESIQRTRSAFSTTEGARIDRNEMNDQQQSLIKQRHRMIDLIDAFANKTALDQETYAKLSQQNRVESVQHLFTMQRASMQNGTVMQGKPTQFLAQQLVGSPLHKSNSISTSTGLSGLNEVMRINERQIMLNNQNSPAIGPRHGLMSSPMVARSTKVMSAHLTPLFNRKEVQDHEGRYFASPGRGSTNFEHMPRPSSIYGQPSLISTPVANARDHRNNDFGSHRSSIHSYHQRMDGSSRGPSRGPSMEPRRLHQTMKTPFLDTTREVAEEISSPTTESKAFVEFEAQNYCRSSDNGSTPRNYLIRQQQHRRTIVNPILQSPTMSLIYDNHPVPISGNGVYSHYDNHRPLEHQQSMSSMDLSAHSYPQRVNSNVEPNERVPNRLSDDNESRAFVSPLASTRNSKLRQSFNVANYNSGHVTPSHLNMRLPQHQANSDRSYPLEVDGNLLNHTKPAALITPLTPTSQRGQESNYASRVTIESTVIDQFNPYSRAKSRPNSIIKPSPIKNSLQQTSLHYQQSPLVDRQARVVTRGDGVQTTVIQPEVPTSDIRQREAVVNMAGAPGVNLEPSLAQSLSRGTNINAFEAPAVGLHLNSNRVNSNTKTFLVSSRLSKTTTKSPANAKKTRKASKDSSERAEREQSRDEESSSRSTSSGTDFSSSSAKSDLMSRRKNVNETRSKSDQSEQGDSVEMGSKGRKQPTSGSSSDRRRRGSSTEHSDELSSQAESFDAPPVEGRKWITSKLMQ